MRAPAKINDEWLTRRQMVQWVQEAPDPASYKRRMAIWLTRRDALHAHEVADVLGVSTQAVWLWISQYNKSGPSGLLRRGRGGRHWGLMTLDEEAELLTPFLRGARSGHPEKPSAIKSIIEDHLGRKVSMSYVYRLLRRHGWAEILAQSHATKARPQAGNDFESLASPWLRET